MPITDFLCPACGGSGWPHACLSASLKRPAFVCPKCGGEGLPHVCPPPTPAAQQQALSENDVERIARRVAAVLRRGEDRHGPSR